MTDNKFKRPNKHTGKPFEPGYKDEDGRVLSLIHI